MHVLLATDSDAVREDVVAALSGPDTSFTVCRDGRDVAGVVATRTPDLVILDLQTGSMGAMATTMALRLDESSGLLPRVKVLMLLDRAADLHLAKRSAADGWIVKPLDALKLQRAAEAILARGPGDGPVAIGAGATEDLVHGDRTAGAAGLGTEPTSSERDEEPQPAAG